MAPSLHKKVAEILGGPNPQDFYFSPCGHGFVTNKDGVKRYYTKEEIAAAIYFLTNPVKPIQEAVPINPVSPVVANPLPKSKKRGRPKGK